MQRYHSNTTTNVHIRCELQKRNLPMNIPAAQHQISKNTVFKWKNRNGQDNRSSRPHTIHYSLSAQEKEIMNSARRSSWLPLEEITEVAQQVNPAASRIAVYRTLREAGLNKVPQQERERAKKFEAYEPGYPHKDVTYCPKLDGVKWYLFVAIDKGYPTYLV